MREWTVKRNDQLVIRTNENLTTSQCNEKVLDRLRPRYVVSSRLTSEPKIMDSVTVIRSSNEDLNALEVFAC